MKAPLFAALLLAPALVGQDASPGASVVLVKAEIAPGHWNSGSGVVVAPGLVATNAHVLLGGGRCQVGKADQTWPAFLLKLDERRDLALLRVPGLNLPPARIAAADDLREGQRVVAIGFPGGAGAIRRQGSLTALWRYLGGRLLQTDAPVAPGSSGGGLFAEDGALLGITTFAFPVGPRFNFAVPAHWALELLEADEAASARGRRGDALLRTFIEVMTRDPANARAWDAFTREWVAASPADAEAWYARSHALDQQLRDQSGLGKVDTGTLQEGVRASRRALELRPEHARAWNNLGVAQDLANDFAAAETAFRRALAIDPGYGLAWLNLGGVLINRRDWGEAARVYRRALELTPDDPIGWARMAFAEGALGHWSEAAAHYRIALRYLPLRQELWKDFRHACLKARDREGARYAEERMAALGADR